MKNPHLTRVLEWISSFESGRLTLSELWRNLALIPSVLEGDVPSDLRQAILDSANELEMIDVAKSSPRREELAAELTQRLALMIIDSGEGKGS